MSDDVSAIDYQPLDAEKHAFRLVFRQHRAQSIVVFAAAAVLCAASPVLGLGSAAAGIGVAALRVFYLAARVRPFINGLWEMFAAVNDWSVNAVDDPLAIIPLSLQFGHGQTFSPAITADLGGTAADLLVYTTTVGSGKSQHTYYFTVARVALPEILPHMLLLAKRGGAEVREDLANHEVLQLEGDFQDYFTLQIEKGQEVDALEILTPDVMQALVSYAQREDVEVAGGYLYFIVNGDDRSPGMVRQLVQSVTSLSGQIIEQIVQTAVAGVTATGRSGSAGTIGSTATGTFTAGGVRLVDGEC